MTENLDLLHRAITRLDAAWAGRVTSSDFSHAQLIAANEALGSARRLIDALHSEIAAGIARESRPAARR